MICKSFDRKKMLLLLFIGLCFAALPECRWISDDPICYAKCRPICHPPKCTFNCINNDPPPRCFEPVCTYKCLDAKNSSVMDSAPFCETKCSPLVCFPEQNNNCQILCEAMNCAWLCEKPDDCPLPKSELTCERPAAEFSKTSILFLNFTTVIVTFVTLAISSN